MVVGLVAATVVVATEVAKEVAGMVVGLVAATVVMVAEARAVDKVVAGWAGTMEVVVRAAVMAVAMRRRR